MRKILVIVGMLFVANISNARVVRATEMDEALVAKIANGTASDIVIEFRQGDELPVSLKAEGDFFETTKQGVSYVGVKKNFWVMILTDRVQVSLDGVNFKDLKEVVTGYLSAGAGTGQNGTANSIQLLLKAFQKN